MENDSDKNNVSLEKAFKGYIFKTDLNWQLTKHGLALLGLFAHFTAAVILCFLTSLLGLISRYSFAITGNLLYVSYIDAIVVTSNAAVIVIFCISGIVMYIRDTWSK